MNKKVKQQRYKTFHEQKELEFLSNFTEYPIHYMDRIWNTPENLYQFMKLPDELKEKYKDNYPKIKPSTAKQYGKKRPLRQDWDSIKLKTMFNILNLKYEQYPELKKKLMNIEGDIIEYNTWKNTYWGYDINLKKGKNYLGKLHMYFRECFRNNTKPKYEDFEKFLKQMENKNSMLRIAIIGSRGYNNYEEFKYILNRFINRLKEKNIIKDINNIIIVSGGAKGADSLAKRYAKENNIFIKEILPNWNKYGKSAGFKRNKEIWNNADIGLGFWDGKSKGTSHSIKIVKELKKDLIMYIYPEKRFEVYNYGNIYKKIEKKKENTIELELR